MQTILLFRHAPVDDPDGLSRCLGSRTEVSASAAGLAAAGRCAAVLRAAEIRAVWSSPMRRCLQTAAVMSAGLPVLCAPGLTELDCGEWDGLTFDCIRSRWPEIYALRGEDPALPPPGGETPAHAAQRALSALRKIAEQTEGNVAAVAHAGLNRALLCALQGLPMSAMRALPQPYLCRNILHYDGVRFTVAAVGIPMDPQGAMPTVKEGGSKYEATV